MGHQTAINRKGSGEKGEKKEAFYVLMWKDLQDILSIKRCRKMVMTHFG